MEIVLGPFHPYLENALVEEILKHKEPNPFSPLLIVVPSDSLRRRLKVLLAHGHKVSLVNIRIVTFLNLSRQLYEEHYGCPPAHLFDEPFQKLYREDVLRRVLRMNIPGTQRFSSLDEKLGGCAALWESLRDLKDGTVDPIQSLEAVRDGYFGSDDGQRVSELMTIYQHFLAHSGRGNIQDFSDLDVWAAEHIPSSSSLRRFNQIFYYGFYDLTQVQLDVFRAVVRYLPTKLFFPLARGHPAWDFAQRFYERYLQGLAQSGAIRNLLDGTDRKDSSAKRHPLQLFVETAAGTRQVARKKLEFRIISCSGPYDEMVVAAKEILRLVDQERILFSEVGVVARSLEPYQPWIHEIFSQHSIPYRTSATEPLRQFPLTKAVLLMIHLAARDYPRSQLMDLVASPFFNLRRLTADEEVPRPDLWEVLTRRLGITKGLDEWRRLERFLEKEIQFTAGSGDDDEEKVLSVSATQMRILWRIFCVLHADLSSLPREESWSRYASAWKALLQKYLTMETAAGTHRAEAVRARVLQTLDRLSALDTVAPQIALQQFAATLERWLDSASIPMTDANAGGVSILDAMSARGIPFRVLFLVGLNEGIFPRTIREDAFLRDRSRRVFAEVLGYKVSEKLGAFDEEKLLFTLLVEAAEERLYGFYQRSDDSGRALSRSWYLDELAHAMGETHPAELTIPRSFDQKRAFEPFRRDEYLLPHELAISLNLRGADPFPVVERFFRVPELYRTGHQMMDALEDSSGRLGAFDGVIRHPSAYWNLLHERGVAPTPLEIFARCPFQFFASQILRLERLEDPEALVGVQPAEAGKIAHFVLRNFYEELLQRNFFSSPRPRLDPQTLLQTMADHALQEYERENPVGYAVAWEVFREDLTELLRQVIRQDLDQLGKEGYRPVACEKEITSRLSPRWGSPLGNLPIQGKLDRIDFMPAANRYRVIDYKFKTGSNPSGMDKNLTLAAIRGQRLQPPFYVLLARALLATQDSLPEVDAAFYFLAPGWRDGPLATASFPAEAWDGETGRQLKETLGLLLAGIDHGLFFIQPGSYCSHCPVSEVCRKNHLPTRWRADNDPLTRPYRELARKKLVKGTVDEEDDSFA